MKLTLIFPRLGDSLEGGAFRARSYTVAAIVKVGDHDMDQKLVVMTLNDAQDFLGLGDKVEAIQLSVSDPENIESTLAPLRSKIENRGIITDWRQMNRGLFSALAVDRVVTFVVLSIILIVTSFNMSSSLIMLVMSKRRDIAIMRTMGATRLAVMRIFVIIGTSIGLVGVLAGCVLSAAFLPNRSKISDFVFYWFGRLEMDHQVNFLARLPAQIGALEIASICLLALLLCFLATLYPAWQASKIDPAEVLRYE